MKQCKHKPVFGYDLALLIYCEKCKKDLEGTADNIRKATLNDALTKHAKGFFEEDDLNGFDQ